MTGGHRYGGDVSGRKTYDGGYYDSLAVLSLYDWDDALRLAAATMMDLSKLAETA